MTRSPRSHARADQPAPTTTNGTTAMETTTHHPEPMREGTTTTSAAGLNRTSVALTLLGIGMLFLLAIMKG